MKTLPLFNNSEVLNNIRTRRDRDRRRYRQFLQGAQLSEAESTKKLWFGKKKKKIIKNPCIPSCHIKRATI